MHVLQPSKLRAFCQTMAKSWENVKESTTLLSNFRVRIEIEQLQSMNCCQSNKSQFVDQLKVDKSLAL